MGFSTSLTCRTSGDPYFVRTIAFTCFRGSCRISSKDGFSIICDMFWMLPDNSNPWVTYNTYGLLHAPAGYLNSTWTLDTNHAQSRSGVQRTSNQENPRSRPLRLRRERIPRRQNGGHCGNGRSEQTHTLSLLHEQRGTVRGDMRRSSENDARSHGFNTRQTTRHPRLPKHDGGLVRQALGKPVRRLRPGINKRDPAQL